MVVKGSKNYRQLNKEFERLNVVRKCVLSSLVINIISCDYINDNGQSATIATDRPQEVFMKLVNLQYQKEQYYNHLRQYYHNKLLIHQQIQIQYLLLRYKMLNNHLYLSYTPFLQIMNHHQDD